MIILDTTHLLSVIVEAGSLISAFAAIAAGFVMSSVTKKFGTGILASGFKTNTVGVFFIALGIIFDAVISYIQVSNIILDPVWTLCLLFTKEACFVLGTYVIVIGSKNTGDKIERILK